MMSEQAELFPAVEAAANRIEPCSSGDQALQSLVYCFARPTICVEFTNRNAMMSQTRVVTM